MIFGVSPDLFIFLCVNATFVKKASTKAQYASSEINQNLNKPAGRSLGRPKRRWNYLFPG